jgi:hypothetical protein
MPTSLSALHGAYSTEQYTELRFVGTANVFVYCPYLKKARSTLARPRRRAANEGSSFDEESDPKERLSVGNWIVQRLYDDAVKETVEL